MYKALWLAASRLWNLLREPMRKKAVGGRVEWGSLNTLWSDPGKARAYMVCTFLE